MKNLIVRLSAAITTLILLALIGSVPLEAQIPRLFSWQGLLTDQFRAPVPDGAYTVTIRLYEAATGGVVLWEESQGVTTFDGVFTALLGDQTPLGVRFDRPYWLAIELQGEPEMTPRIPLVSVPYALNALRADSTLFAARARVADSIAGGRENGVLSLNGVAGHLRVVGSGGTTVGLSGDTLLITSGGDRLPANANDGDVVRWDARSSSWVASGITISTTPRLTGDGSAGSPLEIARMGANDGEFLQWDAASSAWRPGSTSLTIATRGPVVGDGSSGSPISLTPGTTAGESLFWDGTAWVLRRQVVATTARLTGDGTTTSPLDIARLGAGHGQSLLWDTLSGSWQPGSPFLISRPPFTGDGSANAPLGLVDGTRRGGVLYWDGAVWKTSGGDPAAAGDVMTWDPARGWVPFALTVTDRMGLPNGSLWVGGANDTATTLPIGPANAILAVRPDGTGPAWSMVVRPDSVFTDGLDVAGHGTIGGDLTVNGTDVALPNGTIDNAELANSAIALQYGAGISGDATVALGDTLNVRNSGVVSTTAGRGITLDSTTGDVTITNSGVVSATAGRGIALDSTTGAITISSTALLGAQGGTGIDVVVANDTATITNTGVTTLRGTVNQVIASDSTGAVTLSLPQDIHTDATPTFDGLTLDNLDTTSTSTDLLTSNSGTVESRPFSSLFPGGLLPLGTTPNSTLRWNGTSWVENGAFTADSSGNVNGTGDATIGGDLTVNGTDVALPNGTIDNAELANSAIALQYGAGISGDATVALGDTLNVRNSGVVSTTAGRGITLDSTTGDVTITNSGVVSATAGRGIALDSTTGAITISSTALLGAQGGTGIDVVVANDTATITNTGVTTLRGTVNQVIASDSTGAVTLSLPQDIHTDATPTFDGVTLDNLNGASTATDLLTSNSGVVESRTFASVVSDVADSLGSAFWKTDGNGGTDPSQHFLGTTDSTTLVLRVKNDTAYRIIPVDRRFSTVADPILIGGSPSNSVDLTAIGTIVAGGGQNSVELASSYSVIAGGSENRVGESSGSSVISGGFRNEIGTLGGGGTIAGGILNLIDSGSSSSAIGGGSSNRVGPGTHSLIAGGNNSRIDTGSRWASIVGGGQHVIHRANEYGTIGGGGYNVIDSASFSSTIAGGYENVVGKEAWYTTIAGGAALRLNGSNSFGFNGRRTSAFAPEVTIADSNIAFFGSVDLWLGGTHGVASKMKFFEPKGTPGLFPNGTHHTSFEAQTQASDIEYILPDSAGIVGDRLTVSSVTGNRVTLDWDSVSGGGGNAWSLTGNLGTNATTNFLGTSDSVTLTFRVDSTVAFRLVPGSEPSLIGGNLSNTLGIETMGSVIGGGIFNTIDSGADRSVIGGGLLHQIRSRSNRSTIGGGAINVIDTGAVISTISGGQEGFVGLGSFGAVIGGGYKDSVYRNSPYSSILGGENNRIDSSAWSTIGGGLDNKIDPRATLATIAGGEKNQVAYSGRWATVSGGRNNMVDSTADYSSIGGGEGNYSGRGAWHGTIAGGKNNRIESGATTATIGGGLGNRIDTTGRVSVIGGGTENMMQSIYSGILGGWRDTIMKESPGSVIGGGEDNTIRDSSSYSVIAGGNGNKIGPFSGAGRIGGGLSNEIGRANSYGLISSGFDNEIVSWSNYATILNGTGNLIDSSVGSTILGGAGLTLKGDYILGFLANQSGFSNMEIVDSNVVLFGNSDLWLATNDGGASKLKFFESSITSGPFPGVSNYSSFEAGIQNADIRYILPDTAGVVGDNLSVRSVVGTQVTLDWTAGGGGSGWSLTGNAGTNPSTNFLGTTDNQSLVIRVNNDTVMRYLPNVNGPIVVGGHRTNSVGSNSWSSTIAGGGSNTNTNAIGSNSSHGTISGGGRNSIGDNSVYGTVGGGYDNVINNGSDYSSVHGGGENEIRQGGYASTMSGGYRNTITDSSAYVVIAGGGDHVVHDSVSYGTISGGKGNTIGRYGSLSTIGGGSSNQMLGNVDASVIGGGVSNDIEDSAHFSVIDGGFANTIRPNASYSTIGGGYDNEVEGSANNSVIAGGKWHIIHEEAEFNAIGGGRSNEIEDSTSYSVIGGGLNSHIQTHALYSTISGGVANLIGNYADRAVIAGGNLNTVWDSTLAVTISGGLDNNIRQYSNFGVVAGGRQNDINTHDNYSAIGGGLYNRIQGYSQSNVISGGDTNLITAGVTQSVIAGGLTNTIADTSNYSSIGGGYRNVIGRYTQAATIVGGHSDTIRQDGDYSTITGGYKNVIGTSAKFSTIAGGYGLTLTGSRSFGFHANNFFTNKPMEVDAGFTAVFGNTALWLANNDSNASQLRFYEPFNSTGAAFPGPAASRAYFTSFQAPLLNDTIVYILPATKGAAGDVMEISAVNGDVVTLEWDTDDNSSDRRFKREIRTLENALDSTLMLRGVRHDWRREEFSDRNFPTGESIGFIAQEVEAIFPELVETESDGYKKVEYAKVTALLVEAMRAQQEQIDRQNEEIARLRALIEGKLVDSR